MEKVRPWCGQPSDRELLENRTGPTTDRVFRDPFDRSGQAGASSVYTGRPFPVGSRDPGGGRG